MRQSWDRTGVQKKSPGDAAVVDHSSAEIPGALPQQCTAAADHTGWLRHLVRQAAQNCAEHRRAAVP